MKRSIIFGLLCMAAYAVYNAAIGYLLLLIGVPSYFYDTPHVASLFAYEEPLYKIIESGQSMTILYVSVSAFLLILALLLFRLGFLSRQRVKIWRSLPAYVRNLPGGWSSFAVRLVLVAAAAYGCYWLSEHIYLLYEQFSILSYMNSYGSNLGFTIWMAQMLLPSLALAFALGTFAHTVLTFKERSELKSGLAVVAAGAIATVLAIGISLSVNNYLDGNKSLSDIEGVSGKTEQRELMILSETPKEIGLVGGFKDFDSDPFGQYSSVSFSAANEKAIKDYLQKTGDRTVLRKAVYNYIIAKNIRELDLGAALPYYVDGIRRTADVEYWMTVAVRLNRGAVSDVNKSLLDDISDESILWIGGKSAFRLSKAYAHFGDMEKAYYWYDRGAETTEELGKEEIASYIPKDEQPFAVGEISGNIGLGGEIKDSCGVGLIRKASLESLIEGDRGLGNFTLRIVLPSCLISGEKLLSGERFSFAGLPADEYLLILSLPKIEGKKYRVVNSPGPVHISEDNPSVDVGTIELVLETAQTDDL